MHARPISHPRYISVLRIPQGADSLLEFRAGHDGSMQGVLHAADGRSYDIDHEQATAAVRAFWRGFSGRIDDAAIAHVVSQRRAGWAGTWASHDKYNARFLGRRLMMGLAKRFSVASSKYPLNPPAPEPLEQVNKLVK